MEYRTAPEVRAMAEDLVWEHHEDLQDDGPHIEYVMFKAGASSATGGRMFRVRKVTGLHAFLAAPEPPDRYGEAYQARPFVVIEISDFWWNALKQDQRKGMVDHALSHLIYDDDKGRWSIEGPEFGEFPEVFERHGFWRPNRSFRTFAERVSEQLPLWPGEESGEDEDEDADPEKLDVSITFGDRTVQTDIETMNRVARGLRQERVNDGIAIIDGKVVDKETGEVLEESHA